MSIEIEKGVPMPARTRLPDLPFSDMDIGDSFLAPVETGEPEAGASSEATSDPDSRSITRRRNSASYRTVKR